MTAAAPALSTPAPIAADRARGLFRWNASLAVIHFAQFAIILLLSLAKTPMATAPIVSSYLTFDTVTRTLVPAQRTLFELPIGPAVAIFFLLSAIAHFAVAFPARGWYERMLARGQNPARWVEYALSLQRHDRRHRHADGDPGDRHPGRDLRDQRRDEPLRLEHGSRQRGPRRGRSGCTTSSAASPASFPGSSSPSRSGLRPRSRTPRRSRLRHRDLRLAVHQLQRLRDQHDPAVPEDRPLDATTCTASGRTCSSAWWRRRSSPGRSSSVRWLPSTGETRNACGTSRSTASGRR